MARDVVGYAPYTVLEAENRKGPIHFAGAFGDGVKRPVRSGGEGFDTGDIVEKWKGTKKILCWPLYSESVTLTQTEIHVKRNDCPALPRECRPFRGWAVAPLSRISAFYMRKTTTKPLDLLLLFAFSIGLGLAVAVILYSVAPDFTGDLFSENFVLIFVGSFVFFCCFFGLVNTMRAPLRLVINVDGNSDPEQFGIDLHAGKVQPDEVKLAIVEAQRQLA
jgi:hypothetical protein